MPLALWMPPLTLSANSLRCILQGVISLQAEDTPTMGFLKSSSLKPTARSMARLGARLSPSVIMEDFFFRGLIFSDIVTSLGNGEAFKTGGHFSQFTKPTQAMRKKPIEAAKTAKKRKNRKKPRRRLTGEKFIST